MDGHCWRVWRKTSDNNGAFEGVTALVELGAQGLRNLESLRNRLESFEETSICEESVRLLLPSLPW